MGDILYMGGVTRLDIPPDRILENTKGKLQGVLIIGYDTDGNFYASSSYADGGTVLWLMEQCKHELLKCGGIIKD